ncbi:MAG: BRCT domain-containing protein [Phycisphaeraceae bacterium]|nr:MAG: BRCT domain-containing protein [Phycisphaeraceae bacterium]
MMHPDQREYWEFTGPQRLHKALATLGGLIEGAAADGRITEAESKSIRAWMDANRDLTERHPFTELVPTLTTILRNEVGGDVLDELLVLTRRYTSPNIYFDWVTTSMQSLQGLMAGLASDRVLTKPELEAIADWVEIHQELSGVWPYDELYSLLSDTLRDGQISAAEHANLMAFFDQFRRTYRHRTVDCDPGQAASPLAVCASNPELILEGKTYCFTGTSAHGTRKELQARARRCGAFVTDDMTLDTDYVVLGSKGNATWAFSCYGRKVEKALELRKSRGKPLLVHENDFIDAIEDWESGIR